MGAFDFAFDFVAAACFFFFRRASLKLLLTLPLNL
jgi:hypothetical protein